MAGLLLAAPLSYGQKPPRGLVHRLLQVPAGKPIPSAVRQSLTRLSPEQLSRVAVQLERANQQLARQNEQIRQFQQQLFDATRPAVFRALPSANGPRNSFTGTVFHTTYQGKPEVYGLIPMHALADVYHSAGLLAPEFTALVEQDGTSVPVAARVVQLSSAKTGDVALVKFQEKDERHLTSLALADGVAAPQTRLYAQGFACNLPAQGVVHVTGQTSSGLLKTQIPAAHEGERAGFCGSALVNENHELAGVHIGSIYEGENAQEQVFFDTFGLEKPVSGDTGYSVPAPFIRHLVEAYHQPDKPVLSLYIRGQEITKLRVNEFISSVEILDANHQPLWHKDTQFKVTLRPLETALHFFPQARFIRLKIGRTYWQKKNNRWFVTDDTSLHRVVVSGIPALEE